MTRRRESPYALSSRKTESDATTASKLASGSPMPISTTLVIGARPFSTQGAVTPGTRAHAVGDERAVRVPELADDLGRGQVAVETLLAGRAERAVERAARLRRDAQRPAVVFRDVDGLDGVAAADVEQPLARAVRRRRVAHDRRAADLGRAGELFPERLREVGHRVDVPGEALVHPAQHLLRSKRLLAQFGEESREAGGVEIEEVGFRHVSAGSSTAADRLRRHGCAHAMRRWSAIFRGPFEPGGR